MKNMFARLALAAALLALSTLNSALSTAQAQGTAFTYQGQLSSNGVPLNGNYDFQFSLFNALSGGTQVGSTIPQTAIGVTNGLFTTTLDFGSGVFNETNYWLEIAVRTNGGSSFTTLSPRQQLTPTPYSIFAENSGGVNNATISAAQLNTTGAPSSGQVLEFSGGSLVWTNPASGGSGWSLTGNAGTVPGTDFLGTTDNKPLELWVNGMQAFTLYPVGGQVNVVGGVGSSAVNASGGTIGGGIQNTVSNLYPTVSGGEYNTAGSNGATVGGGYYNTATGNQATIAGGADNTASGTGAVVGGGGYDGTTLTGNTASGAAATVAGGLGNTAFYYATVGGGQNNNAATYYSAILGGYGNSTAGGGAGFVGAGYNNAASGFASMVPGGVGNVASGSYSFAAGSAAQAVNSGAFVWADDSSGASFASTANNQFNVRAYGGVRFVTDGAGMTIDGVPVGSGGGGGSASNAWLLTGNAGADPADGYFLGTTDTNGLELHVNALRGLRLDYASESFGFGTSSSTINITGGFWGNTIFNGVVGGTIAGGGNQFVSGYVNFYDEPNVVDGDFGTIGGGFGNYAGEYSTIGGGYDNYAGNSSTIPGGYDNYAVGNGSFALGVNANTSYDGNFVWGDGTRAAEGQGPNSFDVLATGGVHFFTTGGGETVSIVNGQLGVGTTSPSQALEVNGAFMMVDGIQGTQAYIGNGGSGNDVEVGSLTSGITAVSMYNHTDGAYMHVYCSSITIEGGSDLAEPFQISDANTPAPEGAVVVIDEENPGRLKVSDRPYDTRVAGVVSGAGGINPGIQMQQQGLLEGGKNVALTGRVYVQADASNGPIKPGDLLTTSSVPGRAMKVTDHVQAQGAILGKAMTGLKEGQGTILMLVTLQ